MSEWKTSLFNGLSATSSEIWRSGEKSRMWQLVSVALVPVSYLYRCLIFLRQTLYRVGLKKTVALPGVTISVGNITVGGTGKSPLVIAICKELIAHKHRPAIVTRGYGAGLGSAEFMVLMDQRVLLGPKSSVPDEAMMQSAALPGVPIIAGANRTRAVAGFLANLPGYQPSHYVLDDGFQHLKIKRDIDIVVVDGQAPWGNQRLLPAGPLREPARALCRADVVVCRSAQNAEHATKGIAATGTTAATIAMNFLPSAIVPAPHWKQDVPADWCRAALIVTGIARPERLQGELVHAGVSICGCVVVGDHQKFDAALIRSKLPGVTALIVTPKDYWRDPAIFSSLPIVTMVADIVVDLEPLKQLEIWKKISSGSRLQ